MRGLDDSIVVSQCILGDVMLGDSNLTKTEQLMIRTSTRNSGDVGTTLERAVGTTDGRSEITTMKGLWKNAVSSSWQRYAHFSEIQEDDCSPKTKRITREVTTSLKPETTWLLTFTPVSYAMRFAMRTWHIG